MIQTGDDNDDNDLHSGVLWFCPVEELKTSKLVPEGKAFDIVLINYSERHYNLVL